jgi:hypothetical protein
MEYSVKDARLKMLMSACALRPDAGSERGIEWNTAVAVAQHQDMWAITCLSNKHSCKVAFKKNPVPYLYIVYFDIPSLFLFFKKGNIGTHIYYLTRQKLFFRTEQKYALQTLAWETPFLTLSGFCKSLVKPTPRHSL